MEERKILAVFIDFENLALGFKGRTQRFDTARVLARLVEKGDIVVKRAYADWKRFSTYSNELHEAAIELIEIPQRAMTGKNSADMRLCVDAIDLCHSKPHINTFVIVSGDSDFSPLVSKLKENGRHVIGLGMEASTSSLLRDNCHEFIYYEDLVAAAQSAVQTAAPALEEASDRQRKLFALLLESLEALRRENRETLWTSLIKETMKRKRPSFNEAFYGYKSFSRLLEDAARRGLVELARDPANRTYVVTRFGAEVGKPAEGTEAAPSAKSSSRSSRARGSRGSRTRRATSK
ncbi:MAG: NYN domain-containing protein [Deltaproteobacteria bacterium]|nr:NYN domain-containing protein [Deltaproteobacteria bacterium]